MTLISGAQILRHFLYHHVTKIKYFKAPSHKKWGLRRLMAHAEHALLLILTLKFLLIY